MLCGEIAPKRNKRGAPVKDKSVPQEIVDKIEELKQKYLSEDTEIFEEKNQSDTAVDCVQESLPLATAVESKASVSIQLAVEVSSLNERQKQLLHEFLKSL